MSKIISLILLLPLFVLALNPHSAVRNLNESWKVPLTKYNIEQALKFDIMSPPTHTSVANSSVAYKDLDVSFIRDFEKSDDEIQVLFETIRNHRFLDDPDVTNFKRRITWLYPTDGCFVRAEFVSKLIKKDNPNAHFQRVFIFGDLEVKTKNSPSGVVGWWYHVAVLIKHDNKTFVIDPSLDVIKPLELIDWVKLQVKDPNDAELAICSDSAYSPSSYCDATQSLSDLEATEVISDYESYERTNLERLKRDPEAELGNNPPW